MSVENYTENDRATTEKSCRLSDCRGYIRHRMHRMDVLHAFACFRLAALQLQYTNINRHRHNFMYSLKLKKKLLRIYRITHAIYEKRKKKVHNCYISVTTAIREILSHGKNDEKEIESKQYVSVIYSNAQYILKQFLF